MIYVLFSGGLDSWCCLNWAIDRWGVTNVAAVYFDVGQQYVAKEQAAAEKLCASVGVLMCLCKLSGLIEDVETGNIPLRNLHFLLTVANLPNANGVVFGMLQGECPVDKNPTFVKRVQTLLRSQLPDREFSIYTPLRSQTKYEAIANGIMKFGANFGLMLPETIGCFSPSEKPCGQCMSCFNRWVAMTLAHRRESYTGKHPAEFMLDKLLVPKAFRRNYLSSTLRGLSWYNKVHRIVEAWIALHMYCMDTYGVGLLPILRHGRVEVL